MKNVSYTLDFTKSTYCQLWFDVLFIQCFTIFISAFWTANLHFDFWYPRTYHLWKLLDHDQFSWYASFSHYFFIRFFSICGTFLTLNLQVWFSLPHCQIIYKSTKLKLNSEFNKQIFAEWDIPKPWGTLCSIGSILLFQFTSTNSNFLLSNLNQLFILTISSCESFQKYSIFSDFFLKLFQNKKEPVLSIRCYSLSIIKSFRCCSLIVYFSIR